MTQNHGLQRHLQLGVFLGGIGKWQMNGSITSILNESSLHSINFRAEHQIRHPSSLPIPGDATGPPLNDSMGSTFTWISKFWLIIHETFKDGYNNFSQQPMSNAHRMYQLLLDWADNLPEDAKRSDNCPHHVLILQ